MSSPQATRRFFEGFTLVELLVVIAIMAILASLLLAGLGRIRTSADATKDASNLKTIGVAVQQYAAEFGGQLPLINEGGIGPDGMRGAWERHIATYLDLQTNQFVAGQRPPGVFASPGGKARVAANVWEISSDYARNRMLAVNGSASETNKPTRQTSLSRLGTIFFAVSSGVATNKAQMVSTATIATDARLFGKNANVLFLDGHIEQRNPKSTNDFPTDNTKFPWTDNGWAN